MFLTLCARRYREEYNIPFDIPSAAKHRNSTQKPGRNSTIHNPHIRLLLLMFLPLLWTIDRTWLLLCQLVNCNKRAIRLVQENSCEEELNCCKTSCPIRSGRQLPDKTSLTNQSFKVFLPLLMKPTWSKHQFPGAIVREMDESSNHRESHSIIISALDKSTSPGKDLVWKNDPFVEAIK